jgi:hypothetical protein
LALPKTVEVNYIDADRDYESGVARASRSCGDSEDSLAISLPIVMTKEEAKAIAEKRLVYAHVRRVTGKVSLPREYSYLDPSDVIAITKDGVTKTWRVEAVALRGGVVDLELAREVPSIYE